MEDQVPKKSRAGRKKMVQGKMFEDYLRESVQKGETPEYFLKEYKQNKKPPIY